MIEPDEGIAAIGSGGPYAQAAAAALLRNTAMTAEERPRPHSASPAKSLSIPTTTSSWRPSRDQHHNPRDRRSTPTPKQIVAALDQNIVGQGKAKRAVAIALRNRFRRNNVREELRDEITPKNILMIGPTGVGKTEIARRLAGIVGAPFVKVEATKYTEVGYVGRDVESMVRDLVENAIRTSATNAAPKLPNSPSAKPSSGSSTCCSPRRGRLPHRDMEIRSVTRRIDLGNNFKCRTSSAAFRRRRRPAPRWRSCASRPAPKSNAVSTTCA